MRKASENGRLVKSAKDGNMVVGYVLKADIRQYFDTVDHETLMENIRRKIKDKKVLWLIRKILDNHRTKIPGKGMPLGNLTSQFFANLYLNELDYFVKHELRAKYYIRYVDDFVIMDKLMERLELYKNEISNFLKTIKLELHPEKSKVCPMHEGIRFLGFRIFYHHKLLKKSNIRKMEKRLISPLCEYESGEISADDIARSLQSWMGYARQGNTYKLRAKISRDIDDHLRRLKC